MKERQGREKKELEERKEDRRVKTVKEKVRNKTKGK